MKKQTEGMAKRQLFGTIVEWLQTLDEPQRISEINYMKNALHNVSPFKNEPVDCVQWIKADLIQANDYNPNKVAPPEMELLHHSINHDGYTQPIVAWRGKSGHEVVDGFHRTRVGKECKDVQERTHGYLPVVSINDDCADRNDRIAATIRHNRARGKHQVEAMSDIVIELKKRNWTDEKIGRELGMDPDEVLRLCQITGLADVFKDHEFSKAWDIGTETGLTLLDDDDIEQIGGPDDGRIYHTCDKWECAKHNFYGTTPPSGMTADEAEQKYYELLSNTKLFAKALSHIIIEWKYSCEHYLTNEKMNRIAWLGQAALAYCHKIPACFRGGFNRLTKQQQDEANRTALKYLNIWLKRNGRNAVDLTGAHSSVETELY